MGNRESSVEKFLKQSLDCLQVDYVDLYLIHGPAGLQDVGGDLHPRGPDGKLLLDKSTDLVGVWRVRRTHISNFEMSNSPICVFHIS